MGVFVTFEGPEGGGKSTQLKRLAQRLRAAGHTVLETREPGGDEVGMKIRDLLLHGENLHPNAELMLFLADRAHHVANVVRPALAQGQIVLCDRYTDSTVCYQGYGRGLDLLFLRHLNAFVTDDLQPDLTLLLDLPVETGLKRRHAEETDRLDHESAAFHQRVREGFLNEARQAPERYAVIDADQQVDAVEADVAARVEALLAERTAGAGGKGE